MASSGACRSAAASAAAAATAAVRIRTRPRARSLGTAAGRAWDDAARPSSSAATSSFLRSRWEEAANDDRVEYGRWSRRRRPPPPTTTTTRRQFSAAATTTSSSNPIEAEEDASSSAAAAAAAAADRDADDDPMDDEEDSSDDRDHDDRLPPLRPEEYDPEGCIASVYKAAKFNQGWDRDDGGGAARGEGGVDATDQEEIGIGPEEEDEEDDDDGGGGGGGNGLRKKKGGGGRSRRTDGRGWDDAFVRSAVDDYERHLRFVLARLREAKKRQQQRSSAGANASDADADVLSTIHPDPSIVARTYDLLSSSATERAFKALLRTRLHTSSLSSRVRSLERLVGQIGLTPLTDDLAFRLLEANGKGGNVGRALSLLALRKNRGYPPRREEFSFAVRSIQSAGLYLRTSRNVFQSETGGKGRNAPPKLDNPTRWLDAILLNMSSRNMDVDVKLANEMLNCYACTGRTGRAVHFFYRVVRTPREGGRGEHSGDDDSEGEGEDDREFDVRMEMRPPPPFPKIPSEVGDRPVTFGRRRFRGKPTGRSQNARRGAKTRSADEDDEEEEMKSTLEWESSPDWSPALTSAFAFFESLRHGACGHPPLQPDVASYNTLLKVCTYRGALHRALKLLRGDSAGGGGEGSGTGGGAVSGFGGSIETQWGGGTIQPDSVSYNTVLAGLARVGDVRTMNDLLIDMTNKQSASSFSSSGESSSDLRVDKYTVQALVDGYLNVGDVPSAVSLIQDLFNQHGALPPFTSHLKVLEFALANEMPYEARRHVFFLQQLWKWEPSPPFGMEDEESRRRREELVRNVNNTRYHPKLRREALEKLFRYFGEELTEDDFF